MQNIISYHIAQNYTRGMNPDVYEFTPGQGWTWLQRICFWILKKIGANHYDTKVDIKRVEINLNELTDAVLRQAAEVYERENKKPAYLIIGRKQEMELTRQASNHLFMFHVPHTYRANVSSRHYENIFAGMKVVVVPWIDGIFVLPELD